jgi:hypothetical protein
MHYDELFKFFCYIFERVWGEGGRVQIFRVYSLGFKYFKKKFRKFLSITILLIKQGALSSTQTNVRV